MIKKLINFILKLSLFSFLFANVSILASSANPTLPVLISKTTFEQVNARAAIDDFWKFRTVNPEQVKVIPLHLLFSWKHFDVFVRYLYIKSYIEGINYDRYKSIYEKMQIKRVGKCDTAGFNSLIDSFKEHGYLSHFPIPVNENMELLNGSHRLACCLYFKINPYVEIVSLPSHDYPLNWFYENGFSDDEISELVKTGVDLKEQLCRTYDKNTFIGILWNVSCKFCEQIFSQISLNCNIVWMQRYQLDDKYSEFVKDIYKFDGIADWKVEKKLECMHMDPCRSVVVFSVRIPDVRYRFDERKGKAVCSQIESLKSQIRSTYKDKIVPYVFDVVVHMADDDIEDYHINKSLDKYSSYRRDTLTDLKNIA